MNSLFSEWLECVTWDCSLPAIYPHSLPSEISAGLTVWFGGFRRVRVRWVLEDSKSHQINALPEVRKSRATWRWIIWLRGHDQVDQWRQRVLPLIALHLKSCTAGAHEDCCLSPVVPPPWTTESSGSLTGRPKNWGLPWEADSEIEINTQGVIRKLLGSKHLEGEEGIRTGQRPTLWATLGIEWPLNFSPSWGQIFCPFLSFLPLGHGIQVVPEVGVTLGWAALLNWGQFPHDNRKLRTVCSTPSNWGKSFTEGDRAAHYSVRQVTSLSWGGQSTHTMKEGFHVWDSAWALRSVSRQKKKKKSGRGTSRQRGVSSWKNSMY